MLNINNSCDFYRKLLDEFDDFMADLDSARHAMNFAITAHHLHEWVWNDYLKDDAAILSRMNIRTEKREFMRWIDTQSPWFSMVQEISNGSKHFGRRSALNPQLVNDYVSPGYVEPGYLESHFEIDSGSADVVNMPLSQLFEAVVRFWRDFFRNYSPYTDIPKGKTRLSDEQ